MFLFLISPSFTVSNGAKIRNRYNQVPHLTQDTNGKVANSKSDTTNESQEVSPFPAGDHKAHINRRAQRHNKHKTEQIKLYRSNYLHAELFFMNLCRPWIVFNITFFFPKYSFMRNITKKQGSRSGPIPDLHGSNLTVCKAYQHATKFANYRQTANCAFRHWKCYDSVI